MQLRVQQAICKPLQDRMRNYRIYTCVTFAFIFLSHDVKSQFAVAGHAGGIYFDVTPDSLLDPYPYPFGEEYFYVDINQDGTSDIELRAMSQISPGHTGQFISVISLDSVNVGFSFLQTDSGYFGSTCNFWGYADILKPYNYGDTIETGYYVPDGYLAYYDNYTFCPPGLSCTEWLMDTLDHYIGVRLSDTSGTWYGWIRINVDNFYITTVKDFSLWKSSSEINALPEDDPLNIYPNPANHMLIIEAGNIQPDEINLFDISSSRQVISTTKKSLDTRNLREGLYLIEIKLAEKSYLRKIIIRR
jgi:hypothetical protein